MKILYIDMDNVLVDFVSGTNRISEEQKLEYENRLDEVPGIFSLMDPMPGALAAYRTLSQHFDVYILSTAPWLNASAWADKNAWVRTHLGEAKGEPAHKRLILSHHKNLNRGDFLVDDRPKRNGADKFQGELVVFGSSEFPDWAAVTPYLLERA